MPDEIYIAGTDTDPERDLMKLGKAYLQLIKEYQDAKKPITIELIARELKVKNEDVSFIADYAMHDMGTYEADDIRRQAIGFINPDGTVQKPWEE